MNEILDNALDSLRMGLTIYLDEDFEKRQKWAILAIFHAIELLCKERLYQEHRLLIYRNINKAIDEDSQTVGLAECLDRFDNLGIDIPSEYAKIIIDLRRRRNRIEHHRFVPDASHDRVLGKALRFIVYFLEEHLGEEIEVHLPRNLFKKAKDLLLSYEQALERARAAVESAIMRVDPDERDLVDTGMCPECGNDTVLNDDNGFPFCHFCDEKVSMRMCERCGGYLPVGGLFGTSICPNCLS